MSGVWAVEQTRAVEMGMGGRVFDRLVGVMGNQQVQVCLQCGPCILDRLVLWISGWGSADKSNLPAKTTSSEMTEQQRWLWADPVREIRLTLGLTPTPVPGLSGCEMGSSESQVWAAENRWTSMPQIKEALGKCSSFTIYTLLIIHGAPSPGTRESN